jgi:CheY-like chemotaxis protein
MDIQMPNMDGREATKAIRNKEWKYKHIPIIAMTAHALQLEREKSFEAGMDDFLTKPLEIDALFAVLSNYIEIVTVDLDEQKRSIEDCKLPFLDTEIGLMNVGNDHAFYIEILYNFLTDYRDYHETLVNLFKNGEIDDIIVETHTLRGLAATIGATKLDELTQKAETELQAKKYDYDSFMLFVNELRSIVKQLEQYFKENPFRERSIDVQK